MIYFCCKVLVSDFQNVIKVFECFCSLVFCQLYLFECGVVEGYIVGQYGVFDFIEYVLQFVFGIFEVIGEDVGLRDY